MKPSTKSLVEQYLGVNEMSDHYDGRTAATHGVIHPDHANAAKVGQYSDFYSPHNGDKYYGKVEFKDHDQVDVRHPETGHLYSYIISAVYPGHGI